MWEIIKAGGPVMWPILALSVIATGILVERLWTLQERRVLPRDLREKVLKLVEGNQLSERHIAALAQNSPLGRIFASGLSNRFRPREQIREAIEDTGRHVVHDLERFLNLLGSIAAVSPLLGLLGTVIGIIVAFSAITHTGIGDPKVLSGGIGQALITTAAGLSVAIPSLMGYRYLRGHVDELVIEMEKEAMQLVDAIEARRTAQGAPQPAAAAPPPPPAATPERRAELRQAAS
jgi:biopolymer transport protein ExbB